MKWKWSYLFNIDTIAIITMFVAVVYCAWTNKLRPSNKKYKFLGLGESGWDIGEGKTMWRNLFQKPKKKKPRVNKHEERCREIFQKIFRRPFKSVRPAFLKNPTTKKNLELDGYCPDIPTPIGRGLAFEYDGIQHAQYSKYFHRGGPTEFLYQVKKDSWKNIRCKQEGVMLVRIPHFVAFSDLERYITTKLNKMGVVVPSVLTRWTGGMYG